MNFVFFLYVAALFIVLTPGVAFKCPVGGSLLNVALVHGVIFVVVYYFTFGMVEDVSEGFASIAPGGTCRFGDTCAMSYGQYHHCYYVKAANTTGTCVRSGSLNKGDHTNGERMLCKSKEQICSTGKGSAYYRCFCK